VLDRYDDRTAGTYCLPHCGACLSACPERLAVNDVLRYRMYFEDYGREKEGMRLYAALARDARCCTVCPAPCEARCPVGVPIRERMLGADALLRLAVVPDAGRFLYYRDAPPIAATNAERIVRSVCAPA
jgi:hypothetical protein